MVERYFLVSDGVLELNAGMGNSRDERIISEAIDMAVDLGKVSMHEDSMFDPKVVELIFAPMKGVSKFIDEIYTELKKRAYACQYALVEEGTDKRYLNPTMENDFFILVKAYFSEIYEVDHNERYKIAFEREILLQDAPVRVNMAYQRFVNHYENSNN